MEKVLYKAAWDCKEYANKNIVFFKQLQGGNGV